MKRDHRARWRAPFLSALIIILVVGATGSAAAVTGGSDTDIRFLARLALGNTEHACTGVLVDPRAVLTAASCFGDGARTGAPAVATTATIGRTAGAAGVTTPVTQIVVHPGRDLALARLTTPVTDITPVDIAASAPAAGDVLTLAGFGRTGSEWIPNVPKAAGFTVDTVVGATFETVPAGTDTVGLCRGDAGGPALRPVGGTYQLVAVHRASNQAGCLGEAAGSPRTSETRVDDVRTWVLRNLPGFATTFETGDTAPNWQNTADSTGIQNVAAVCCTLTGPELVAGSIAAGGPRSGTGVLLYSGKDTSATTSYAYLKAFDLSSLPVRPNTVLSYWIHPQSKSTSYGYADGNNSTCVAVDLLYTDNTTLRDSGVRDQRGNLAHPSDQCNKLPLDTWTEIRVPIGTVAAGKRIATLSVGYDQTVNTGGYRGFVDDITVSDDGFATGFEAGQYAPNWNNAVSDELPGGGLANVGGVCCDLAGPELFVSGSGGPAHTGENALLYSGKDNNVGTSFAYMKVIRPDNLYVTPTSRLSYWIFPQSKDNSWGMAEGNNSMCAAVDLIYLDGNGVRHVLRDAGARDQHGNLAHPTDQCGHLTLDTWNWVSVPLGKVAGGAQIVQIDLGYDQPAGTGGYRGLVDDIRITQ
jgi:hypothetical protein